jgi:hypothetical protein
MSAVGGVIPIIRTPVEEKNVRNCGHKEMIKE